MTALTTSIRLATPFALAIVLYGTAALAEHPPVSKSRVDSSQATTTKARPYSPYANREASTGLYWGDTHLHTSYSIDSAAFGNQLGIDAAYRFARGEQVDSSLGQPVRLARPLDFLVVSDHSDNLGFFPDLAAGKEHIVADPLGRKWFELLRAGKNADVAMELIETKVQGRMPAALVYSPESAAFKSAWAETVETADRFNDPGRFTAFIGYEWTSSLKGNNLHRVVVYRDGADKGGQMVPFTTERYGSPNPRDLWKWMDEYEARTGGRMLAIPHNGNLSSGIMFPLDEQYDGTPIDEEYVRTRARREPIYEATQLKGDSETHPFLSPDDEFADFEPWDQSNLDFSVAKTNEMLPGEYARSALKRGLALETRFGTNPYAFGMIGSTDSHTSLSTHEENNYFSENPAIEPSPTRAVTSMKMPVGTLAGWQTVASGLAAIWATDNTRAALFDAMERKEVYATTGSRITVRFFGGWSFDGDDVAAPDAARVGYEKGVPMGGILPARPDASARKVRAPSFMVFANRDPIGANLDRIQIIKGWLDKTGKTNEKVYDVAWSDARKPGRDGKLPAVGTTVDLAKASWKNTIGASELATTWTDPDFDPKQQAFYYVRVIEIPTPRWPVYDAYRLGAELPPDSPTTIQERAYTSPIWYAPN